jgi:hypothetical protein
MEKVMATRKTSTKTAGTPPAKAPAGKSASKAEIKTVAKAEPAARKRAAPASSPPPAAAAAAAPVRRVTEAPSGEARYRWIAHAAYLRAEKRGFSPGQEVADWLEAEAEFLAAHGLSKD